MYREQWTYIDFLNLFVISNYFSNKIGRNPFLNSFFRKIITLTVLYFHIKLFIQFKNTLIKLSKNR